MWKPILSVVLVIFLTVSLFLLVYGMAYLVVYKVIDWSQKIAIKLREKPQKERIESEEEKRRRERERFGPPRENDRRF